MILQLIQNAALLVTLAVGLQMLARRTAQGRLLYAVIAGLIFGAVGIAGMMTPVTFAPGVIYDGRSIVLSLAGLFGGPLPAALAAVLCGAYRIHLGGAGAVAGVSVIVEATLLGVGLHYLRKRDERWVRPLSLLAFGVLVHVLMMLLQLLIPGGVGWTVLSRLGPIVLVVYPVAFLMIAQVFLDEERRRRSEDALRTSEDRYRQLAERSDAIPWEYSIPQDRWTYVAPQVKNILGYGPEEWTDLQSWHERLHPEDRHWAADYCSDCTARGEAHEFQYRFVAKDGRIVWLRDVVNVEMRGGVPCTLRGFMVDITAQKKAEFALRESEAHYRSLFEDNCAAMMVLDPDTGAIVDANPAACAFYGWTRDELCAMRITQVNLLSDSEIQADLNRARESTRNRFFFRHQLADGSVRDVEVFSGPIELEGRRLLFSIIHDISERRRAEAALAERERQLTTLMANLPGMAYRCRHDEDWTMLFVSDGALAVTGYQPEDLRQNARIAYSSLIHPDDREYVRCEVQAGVSEGRPFVMEYRIIHASGEERWVWEQGCGAISPGGHHVVEGFICDITERKLAQDRIDHLNLVLHAIRDINKLIVSEREADMLIRKACRLIIEHRSYASALIVLTGERGQPKAWAQAGLGEHFALLEQSLQDGALPLCCRLTNNSAAPFLMTDRMELCTNCPVGTDHPLNDTLCTRLKHGDAAYGYLIVSLAHELGVDEEEQGLFVEMATDLAFALNALEDRAARARAEQDREHMQQQLLQAQKMEAVGQLAGGVAHDFNNILQAVMGYAHILIDTAKEAGQPCEELDEIYRGAERAAGLTRQLLAFSRRQVIRPAAIDLNQLMDNLLNMLARVIGEHIRLVWLPGNKLGTIQGDAGMMEQVLMNLCLNARDAMEHGGVLTIETQNVRIESEYCSTHAWARPGRYVLLSVTDTGCGMDSTTLGHVFEPFFTTKEEGKGTGLGLSMVYGIVKQHDGMISAYSEPGKGTTFKIYLPTCEQNAEVVGPMIEGIAGGGSETILLAEDDDGVRKLAKMVLERAGYTVLTAEDGEEAVAVFEEHASDIALVILDVVMPRLGGHKALERIRALRPEAAAIFSSGYSENAVHTNFVLHEGLTLIQKPYAPDALLRAVRGALDKSATAQN